MQGQSILSQESPLNNFGSITFSLFNLSQRLRVNIVGNNRRRNIYMCHFKLPEEKCDITNIAIIFWSLLLNEIFLCNMQHSTIKLIWCQNNKPTGFFIFLNIHYNIHFSYWIMSTFTITTACFFHILSNISVKRSISYIRNPSVVNKECSRIMNSIINYDCMKKK